MNLFRTNNRWPPFILRIFLSIVLWPHGAQKLLGWFGGYDFHSTMEFFTKIKGLPWAIGFMVIIIEFFGSLCLLFGLATRIWSSLIILLFLGIIYTSHPPYWFFMNWDGAPRGEGLEYYILAIGMAASLVISGSGKYALDHLLVPNEARTAEPAPEWEIATEKI
jgi:putative oxidoreductase